MAKTLTEEQRLKRNAFNLVSYYKNGKKARLQKKAWKDKNKEYYRAQQKEYYEKNKKWIAEKNKIRNENNKEKRKVNAAAYYQRTKEERRLSYKKCMLKKQYGLTLEEYNFMLILQEHRCAICGAEESLVVDHCHDTGNIRKLLCNFCNFGLGFYKDNPERLRKAAAYLEDYSCLI